VSPALWCTRETDRKKAGFVEIKSPLKGAKVLIVFLEMCGKMCYGNCARGAPRPFAATLWPAGKTRRSGRRDMKKISLFWALFSVWKSHLGVQ